MDGFTENIIYMNSDADIPLFTKKQLDEAIAQEREACTKIIRERTQLHQSQLDFLKKTNPTASGVLEHAMAISALLFVDTEIRARSKQP